MTTSPHGDEKDARIAQLERELATSQAEVNLHLATVRRQNFMPPSYRQFLEQVHPEDLDRALRFAAVKQAEFSPTTSSPFPEGQAAVSVLDLPSAKPVPHNIFTTGPGAHLEFRYLNQDGEYRWFRASAKHYQPEDGPEQIIGLIIDINDIKLLEDQRKAVNEELKAFMYSVAQGRTRRSHRRPGALPQLRRALSGKTRENDRRVDAAE